MAGEAGGEVPDPVAEGIGVGVPQVRVVAVAEETGPGREVGGRPRGLASSDLRVEPGGAVQVGPSEAVKLDDVNAL